MTSVGMIVAALAFAFGIVAQDVKATDTKQLQGTWVIASINGQPMPEGAPRDRLGFALWVADPRSPTTARVIVNRIWQAYFGAGILTTVEDFGRHRGGGRMRVGMWVHRQGNAARSTVLHVNRYVASRLFSPACRTSTSSSRYRRPAEAGHDVRRTRHCTAMSIAPLRLFTRTSGPLPRTVPRAARSSTMRLMASPSARADVTCCARPSARNCAARCAIAI